MAAQQSCLLDDIIDLKEWTVSEMIKIENHISAGICPKVHPPLKDLAKEKGCLSTCLIRACHEGDIEALKKIVEFWEADVNSAATHFLTSYLAVDLEVAANEITPNIALLGATPLFVAASGKNTEVIRYLVAKGADVLARTSVKNRYPFAGITPLHGAMLFNSSHKFGSTVAKRLKYAETIRVLLEYGADPSALSSDGNPTWMFGMNCLCSIGCFDVNVISLLVEHGMSLDQKCPRLGRTFLHHMAGSAIVSDTVKIVKLILEKGADPRIRDRLGITPIMTAAIRNNMSVLKLLMEKTNIPNTDKIDALEVAVAELIICYPDLLFVSHEIDYCLARSRNLRTIEGAGSIPKIPSVGRAIEWEAPFNLEYVEQRSPLERKIQSFLTRLRIFSSISWGAVHRYVWPSIEQYILELSMRNQYAQLLDISWIMLETIRRLAPTSDATEICLVTEIVVGSLVESLQGLKREGNFNSSTLQTSLKLVSSTFSSQCNRFDYPSIDIGLHLCRLFSILADEPDAVIESVGEDLFQIVKLSEELIPNKGKFILIACMDIPQNLFHVDNTFRIVRLLLKFGADPDAVDGQGNGPLHHLAKRNGELVDEVARLFLDSGAHFDRANKEGLTPVDVWKKERVQENKRRRLEDQLGVGWEDRPDWLQERNVPRLLCLSARAIRSHRVPYLEKTPVTLHLFIEMHKSN